MSYYLCQPSISFCIHPGGCLSLHFGSPNCGSNIKNPEKILAADLVSGFVPVDYIYPRRLTQKDIAILTYYTFVTEITCVPINIIIE